MQIEKVLVPMDFSLPSGLALIHGIAFARKFRARLTLLHVVEPSSALTNTFPTETERIEKEHSEHAQRMLSTLIAPEDQDDLDLQTLVKSGEIEDQILTTIRQERTDLVVMGTHGRGLVGRSLIGSVTQKVLRKVKIPILTVCRAARSPAFDRILFATDLSEPSKERSRFVLELARMTGSNLIALNAVEVGLTGGAEAAVADTILKAAEQNSADLIVVTVQQRGMLDRPLLDSTAERVIRQAHIPVLSIPVGVKARPQQTEKTDAA